LPMACRNSSAVNSSHFAGNFVGPCAQQTEAIPNAKIPVAQRSIQASHFRNKTVAAKL